MASFPSYWRKLLFPGILPILMVACFNERSPEKPAEGTDWVSPTEISILMDNLSRNLSTLNLNNYRRCLASEKFSFLADPTLAANNQGLFGTWNWDKENQFFNNLNRAAQPVSQNNSLVFSNIRNNNFGPDSVEVTADYQLSVYHQDTAFKTVNFRGLASFQIKRNTQNEWQIVKWQDNKTGTGTCITELRQHFFAP